MQYPGALTLPHVGNTFCGVPAAQTWNDLALWEVFFNLAQVASVIELGTFQGGMALFFAMQGLARGFSVVTIDSNVDQCKAPDLLRSLNCERLKIDLISGDAVDEITALLDRLPKPTMLFCDNGNKPSEWNRFVRLLSPGDFAAVHDWGTEFGPENLDPHPESFLLAEAESIQSMTRFFRI
jgi:cephalosporin hydroxylase